MNELKTDVKKSTRDGFGEAIVELAAKNRDVIALTANLGESTRLADFRKQFPGQYIECGVAEQNMAGIAAGLALEGKIPFMTSFSAFSPGRNWEQIRVSICYNQANVKIISTHAGLTAGQDGATHQALEDLAITRVIPNLTVICPADFIETKKAIIAAAAHVGPVYIRLGREPLPMITEESTPFKIGQANVLKEGTDLTIIATGLMVHEALLAAEKLIQDSIDVEVINCATIKPLDEKTILESAKKTGLVVTAEEHQVIGGLGGAVAELLSERLPTKMLRVGINDVFGESATTDKLQVKYGCDSTAIIKAVHSLRKTK